MYFLVYRLDQWRAEGGVQGCQRKLKWHFWFRFVLSMVLRTHEGNEAQVCFFIIQVTQIILGEKFIYGHLTNYALNKTFFSGI